MRISGRRCLRTAIVVCWLLGLFAALDVLAGEAPPPLKIGLTAEFGVQGSHAAQSIEKGILLAIDEINAAGGVLGGRRLVLESRDDRGVPARGMDNFSELAAMPDLVAVFCGRFSPVALEIVPLASRLGLPFLDPWSAADSITAGRDREPNYAFRLSLTDTWAMQAILDHARGRGLRRLALFVPNTAWGRSNEAALLAYARRHADFSHITYWYNWGDTEFGQRLAEARRKGGQAVVMVANEAEGIPLLRQMAALPASERLPIVSHWGILGGDFAGKAGATLDEVDFSVVHTFSFADPQTAKAQAVAAGYRRLFGSDVARLRAQVGFAHAYDLTHLLAKAIARAGSGERKAIRDAFERLPAHNGLVRRYVRPFTPGRHEALAPAQVAIARFDRDGNLKSLPRK